MTGTWRITFSMRSDVFSGNDNLAYLYHNGEQMQETEHHNYSGNAKVIHFTGGREILLMAEEDDTLTIRSERLDDNFYNILVCFEYISV